MRELRGNKPFPRSRIMKKKTHNNLGIEKRKMIIKFQLCSCKLIGGVEDVDPRLKPRPERGAPWGTVAWD